jgi:hypothetical protein
MTRIRRLKWPTPYGIQLETSPCLRCPFSDRRSQRISSYLFGVAQTDDAESDSELPYLDRDSDAETAASRPAYAGAAVKQMQSIQIQSMQQGSDALDAALAEIETGLKPDQQKRLEHFRERRREFLQRAISRRDASQ